MSHAPLYFHYVAHLPRRVAHALPARSIGFEPAKTSWIDRTFGIMGVAFVLRGNGEYREDGRTWRVAGPCLLLQYPEHYYRYGPDTSWEEFYVSYTADHAAIFRARGWADLARPVVPLGDDGYLRQGCREIFTLTRRLEDFGVIDRIDQLYEGLLLAALVDARQPAQAGSEQRLEALRAWVDAHYAEAVDWEALARRHGFALRTLRRLWRLRLGDTPGEYLTRLRVRRACELLAGTTVPVGEVAQMVGYPDPFYFSRRFHQQTGTTPSAFRQQH